MNKKLLILVLALIFIGSLITLTGCKEAATEYAFVFDCNGGEFVGGQSAWLGFGTTATLPDAPTKDGYVFDNWYTDTALSSVFNTENEPSGNMTLYAKWIPNTNTLNFDANSGEGSMTAVQIATGATEAIPTNTFTKANYTFLGWATSSDGEVVYSGQANYEMGVLSEYTLYAVWKGCDVDITVDCGFFNFEITATYGDKYMDYLSDPESDGYSFDGWTANISSGIEIDTTTAINNSSAHSVSANWIPKEFDLYFDSNGGENANDSSVIYDAYYGDLPVITRIGYTFDGWYTERSGGDRIVEFSTVKTPSNHSIYAHWIPNVYNVVFDSCGGDPVDSISVTYDSTYGMLTPSAKDGYTFSGWYTSLLEGIRIEPDTLVTITDTQTLYAVWATIEYDITYVLDNGTNNASNPASFNIEDESISILAPTRDGYTFTGWFEADLLTPANTTIASGSTGDKSYYAVWEANINDLVFDANDGDGTMDNMEIATDDTVALDANTYTRTGYTFEGWATSAEGAIVYLDEANYTMGTAAEYTLYAVWATIEYDITYVLDNGTNNAANPASYNIEDESISILAPTRDGYTFMGWFEADLTTPADTTIASGSTGNKSYYAVWEANINDLVLDANGGEGTMDNMEIATDDTVVLNANTYIRTGYTFEGWAYTAEGAVVYLDEANYTMGTAAEYTLYAVWATIEYDITYVLDNGTNNAANPVSYNIEDESISILAPTRDGYTFTGWFEADLTTPANTTIASGSNGNKSYYAVWEANINDLVLDANGGEGTMDNMEIATDDTVALDANTYTRTGYTFEGWAYTAEGAVVYADEANYTMGTAAEYTLYAVWEAIAYTVTFDKQSGTGGNDDVSATFDQVMPEATAPSRTGYTFAGYYTEISGGGTQYYDDAMISINNWDIASNTTLYAKWTPNNYNLIFDANGGNALNPNKKEVTFDSAVGELPTPTRIGHTFESWNTLPNGTGTTYTQATTYTIADNLTLYADWQINQYTISFESNGGTSVSSITQDYNSVVSAPTAPTKDDFFFAGWYSDEAITEFYVFDRIPAENITLYADWGTEGLGFVLINDNTEYAVYKGTLAEGESLTVRIPRRYNNKYVTAIGNGVWSNSFINIRVTSIHIPSSITVIDDYAFHSSDYLTSITLPQSITKIGMLAFYESALTSINIPSSVTEIGDYAFQLSDISSLTLNEGLETVGRGAFQQCNNLTSITIPSTVTNIGGFYGDFSDNVFMDCVNLTSVTINATTPPTLSAESTMIFKGCTSLANIYVPSQSVNTYKAAQGWSTYASKITAIAE